VTGSQRVQRGLAKWLSIASITLAPLLGVADVIRDGSIGPGPEVQVPSGPECTYCILENLGARSGRNLYHSFSEFDVASGEVANFFASPDVNNVIARIPGADSASTIAGHVSVESGNLYLLNPVGVLFTDGASFDIPGALYASTANSIYFASDPSNSFVIDDLTPVLSPAEPSHFAFDGGRSGDVEFKGGRIIGVNDGERITVVARNVLIEERTKVRSRGGLIELAAVGDVATRVPIDVADFDVTTQAGELGTIRVSGSSWVNGLPEDADLPSAGRVVMRGGELRFEGQSFVMAGGDGVEPAIDLEAQRLIDVDASLVGDAGSDTRAAIGIHMDAPRIDLHDRARVIAETTTTRAG
jgi:filamentous hemagglutinin family protein